MLNTIINVVMDNPGIFGGGTVLAVLVWLLERIPNDTIKEKISGLNESAGGYVGKLAYGVGAAVTGGLAKWRWSAKIWNSTVEAYIIDLINNVVVHGLREFFDEVVIHGVQRFIDGMKSDN